MPIVSHTFVTMDKALEFEWSLYIANRDILAAAQVGAGPPQPNFGSRAYLLACAFYYAFMRLSDGSYREELH